MHQYLEDMLVGRARGMVGSGWLWVSHNPVDPLKQNRSPSLTNTQFPLKHQPFIPARQIQQTSLKPLNRRSPNLRIRYPSSP